MKSATLFQILGNAVCVLLHGNTLWKRMSFSSLSTPNFEYIVRESGFFNLGETTSLREGKL